MLAPAPDASMHTKLLIDGTWRNGAESAPIPVINPATEEQCGEVERATITDLDDALKASERGFREWSSRSAFDRSKILRAAAELLRERTDAIAPILTREQGKPLAEAKGEILTSADIVDWFAEEARRTYGQVIPARSSDVRQITIKDPVGPVATFTPWNFPINAVARKLSAALAAGCSVIVKGNEETPASAAALVQTFVDAGVPAGAVNLVFGEPAEISNHLIASPTIRKISFTGSTTVGKTLASLAGTYMKRVTMELGGHAPVIVTDDADIETAIRVSAFAKFRNAGQICISPTRFLIQQNVYDRFLSGLVEATRSIVVGNGLDNSTTMGPLANERRLVALEALISDAVSHGAELRTGGTRIGNKGYFLKPTVLAHVPTQARVMNDEPFGPLAIVNRFTDLEEAIAEANRLPFGLASYAFTGSLSTAHQLSSRVEAGMLSINQAGLSFPEVRFGGVKDSGYGCEGGSEAIDAYIATRFVSLGG